MDDVCGLAWRNVRRLLWMGVCGSRVFVQGCEAVVTFCNWISIVGVLRIKTGAADID